jgi:hypothetical protein
MDSSTPSPAPSPTPTAPRRGWWSRNWKWFVPTGCLTLFVLFCAFIAIIMFGVFAIIKSSDTYKDALARAKADPRVVSALGQPIKPGMFVSGSSNSSGGSEHADLAIPISGPKGSGKIYAVAVRSGGKITYTTLAVEVQKTGERIELAGAEP